jgi:two-component system sensor histidine kinase QseC
MKRRSIKTYLLASFVACIFLGGLLTTAWSYWHTRHEVGEVFDAQIAQTARLYHALLLDHMDSDSLHNIQKVLNNRQLDEQWQSSWKDSEHPYEYALIFQAWGEEGQTLVFHDDYLLETPPTQAGYQDIKAGGTLWRVFVIQDTDNGITLLAAQSSDIRSEIVGQISLKILLPIVLMIPLLMLSVGWILTRGFMPLDEIGRILKQRSMDDLSPIVINQPPTEVDTLVGSLNQLFDRLERSVEHERRFTDDAAHELRTPLAALALQLESSGVDSKNYPSVFKAVSRLQRLVSQLLLLARSTGGYSDRGDVWNHETLAAESADVIADIVPLADERGVNLGLNVTGIYSGYVKISRETFAIVLRNLIENAVRYTVPNDQVDVEIQLTQETLQLLVIDHGPGLSDELKALVLERFFRAIRRYSEGS